MSIQEIQKSLGRARLAKGGLRLQKIRNARILLANLDESEKGSQQVDILVREADLLLSDFFTELDRLTPDEQKTVHRTIGELLEKSLPAVEAEIVAEESVASRFNRGSYKQ